MAKNPYPNLTSIIEEMAADNDMRMKPVSKWKWPANAPALEAAAATLTEDQKETLAAGEETELRALCELPGIQEVSDFIDQVFDGDLTYDFARRFLPGM